MSPEARSGAVVGRFEVEHSAPHFLPGVFDAQNIGTLPVSKLIRRPATLPDEKLAQVEGAVKLWLGLVAEH